MSYTIGIDLGGTNIAAGLVDENCRIVERAGVKTNAPRSAQALCDDMAALCRELAGRAGLTLSQLLWVGLGSPGTVWENSICFASNLGLRDAPIADLLAARVDRPVHLHNDANTAAYGEYMVGAGRGCRSLATVTIGTGIGSGVILDGRIYSGFNGAAAELGHTIIHPRGRPCTCGKQGCFETYCSATGLIRSTRLAMEEQPDSAMWRLSGGLERVSGRTAFQAMAQGDMAGAEVVREYIEYLAIGVANIVNILQPEMVCIGGGVSKEGDTLILPLRERVRELSFSGRGELRSQIVAAQLGNDAGIVGAALLGHLA